MILDAAKAHTALRWAWPGLKELDVAGWTVRLSRGGYDRANSVWPARFFADEAATAIDEAEALFRAHRLTPKFQIIDGCAPEGLDAALQERGYKSTTPCHVLAKEAAPGRTDRVARITAAPDADWLSLYLSAQSAAKAEECPDILARIAGRQAFFSVERDGETASVGCATLHDGCAAIDCILTRPDFRRRGASLDLLTGLEAWAAAEGAEWLVLAVVADNVPACALYERLGFERIGGYVYRVG